MKYQLLFFLFLVNGVLNAQTPDPCPDAMMTSFCADACVVCDIDGFSGVNDLTAMGQGFEEFMNLGCTTQFNNMQYLAFIAGSENLTIRVDVGQCIGNWPSLEVGFFESLDCQTFSAITPCDTDIPSFTSETFTNFVPLVIGRHYYLVIDGSGGANCDWTFNVVEGSTAVLPLTITGDISYSQDPCTEAPVSFSVTGEVGADLFYWTIDGVSQAPLTADVDFNFPDPGSYEVCVTAANACDEAEESCTTVTVREVQSTLIDERLCDGECIEVNGTQYCNTGTFQELITLPNGCDSIIDIEILVLPQALANLDVWICNVDTFFIGTTPYTQTGSFTETILTADDCDSLVNLELLVIECEIIGMPDEIPVICHGTATGTLIFSVNQGEPPLTYTYTNIEDTSITGTGMTNLLVNNEIPNIPAGVYRIYIEDDFGNDAVVIQEVTQPEPMEISLTASDYGGCFGWCPPL